MTYDIQLKVYDEDFTKETQIITTNHLPKIGERIFTPVFVLSNEQRTFLKTFRVLDVIHYYNDDFSEIDYTEIKLTRSL